MQALNQELIQVLHPLASKDFSREGFQIKLVEDWLKPFFQGISLSLATERITYEGTTAVEIQ